MKECIVVLGMHRSGTSVLSGLVSMQGYYLGADEMPVREDNPKGFYENNKIYQLNQQLLIDHQTSWDEYSFTMDQIDPEDLYRYENRAREIIKEEFGPTKRIFMKDPRMCLLFPLWEKILLEQGYTIKVILAYRSPMEVVHSLKRRNDMPIEKSLMMWSHHFFQAEKATRNYDRMLVRYDNDIRDLDAFFKKLSRFLNSKINDEMIASAHDLYTPKLKHHQLEMDNLSDDVPRYLTDFIALLKEGDIENHAGLDKIIDEFYHSQKLFLFNEKNLEEQIRTLEDQLKGVNLELERSEINVKHKEQQIQNSKEAITDLQKDFKKSRESLQEKIAVKNITIRNLESNVRDYGEKLEVGAEVFRKAFVSPEWKKKLGRTVKGNSYYKNKEMFSFFAKRKAKCFLNDKVAIVESGLFSPFYYLTQNPDVWRAGVDPLNHFMQQGWKEGRSPSQYFNCAAYLKENGDVRKSTKNPLLHYIRYGKAEGRSAGVNAQLQSSQPEDEFVATDTNCVALTKAINSCNLPEIQFDDEERVLVSIIVLNRDGLEHLKVLLPALIKYTQGINYELIVVDNASSDDSVEYLENSDHDVNIKIIKNAQNETFSKANNIAAEQAQGKYLVLLNNDVEPLKGWLHHLIHVAETEEGTGSVGSRLIYPFKESFKNSCTVQHAGIAFRDEVGFLRPFNRANGVLIDSPMAQENGMQCAVTAACLLVTKEVYLEVGGLDEGYNYGFEDVDFGLKLIQAGYPNYYCADSVLFHYEFGTQNKNNRDEVVKRREKNATLLREKWAYSIKQQYWKEKLFGESHQFTEGPLKVAITVTDYGPDVAAGDYFTAQELAGALENLGWEVVYLSRVKNEWYQIDEDIDVLISLIDAFDMSQLPERNTRLVKIAWARNWFDRWCENEYFHEYDFVFASSHIACEYIQNHSKQEALLLPIASNPERFINKPDCQNVEQYKSDFCFTGNYWSSPRDIMEALSEEALQKYDFHVYGANWDKFEKFKPYHKGFIAYQDVPCAYHHTRIVIDDAVNHITKPYGSVNSRVFDALMAGALVITNGIEGSKDLFGGELPYYETSQELDELLDFYLNNEKARKDKIHQLKEIITSGHTYEHRAESIRNALVKRFMSPSVAIKIPAPNWEGAHSWGDYHMAVLLKKQLEQEGYYVLLQILPEWDNDEGMECDAVIVLRGLSRYNLKSHQINIMWNISHPDKVPLDEYDEYDQVYIASEVWAKKISEKTSTPVETLFQCSDPARFKVPNENEKKLHKQQLLFVGNSRGVFRKVLKDLLPTDYDLSVYGKSWKKLIPAKYIKGEHISNDELYKYYGSADILLNDHWDDMREQGFVSNRIFDGLASGAYIITDKVCAMGELEKYVCTYSTPEELREAIRYSLDNPKACREMAMNGMHYVAGNHTFKERAKQFSAIIQTHLSSRLSSGVKNNRTW